MTLLLKPQKGPILFEGDFPEGSGRLHHEWIAHQFEQRNVGLMIAVCIGTREIKALLVREFNRQGSLGSIHTQRPFCTTGQQPVVSNLKIRA